MKTWKQHMLLPNVTCRQVTNEVGCAKSFCKVLEGECEVPFVFYNVLCSGKSIH